MFENKKILILGFSKSGYEVSKWLSDYHNDILITDCKEQDASQVQELKEKNVRYVQTTKQEELLDDTFDLVIKNPGIVREHPCVLKARKYGIPVLNELEVAYHFLPKNVKIIGITGSNGKTTTTSVLYEILKEAKLPVKLGGNIGYPVSSLLPTIQENDILLLEISDHQLVDMYDFKTNISVLTNLSEVHLDFHGSYDIYKQTKKKIFAHHTGEDLAILNLDNVDVCSLTQDIESSKMYFSDMTATDIFIQNDNIVYKGEEIISLNDILLKGYHNYENCMCAILVAKQFSVTNEIIQKVLKSFKGVEHRMEYVLELCKRKFYNDSKSTNIESTITALKSFSTPVILLLGGLDRGHSFDGLIPYLKQVRFILTYGETKYRIEEFAHQQSIPCVLVDNLEMATKRAYQLSNEGDTILLSPACASWDQYETFEQRGIEFKSIVNSLK